MTFNSFPIPTKAGFESLLLQKAQEVASSAQSAEQDADRAETARDATVAAAQTVGAFAEATLAAAIAAGLAGTTEDETFTATGDDVDYIGLYRHDSGSVSFEIARLPKSQTLDAVRGDVDRLAQIGRDAEQVLPEDRVSDFLAKYPEFWDTGDRFEAGSAVRAVVSGWRPTEIFATGDDGGVYLAGPEYCFTDTAGTTHAGDGDPVALWLDASGNGKNITQPTLANRPILQQDFAGFWYLAFDGETTFMETPAFPNGHSAVEIFAAAHKLSPYFEFSSQAVSFLANVRGVATNSWSLRVPGATSYRDQFSARSTTIVNAVGDDVTPPPHRAVWTGRVDLLAGFTELRADGVQIAVNETEYASGAFDAAPAPLTVGRKAITDDDYWTGRLYGLIYRQSSAPLPTNQVAQTERYLSARLGPLVHSAWQGVTE